MNETRSKALKWWRNLSTEKQLVMSKKNFPDKLFIYVTTSSMKIEQMFVKEFETEHEEV